MSKLEMRCYGVATYFHSESFFNLARRSNPKMKDGCYQRLCSTGSPISRTSFDENQYTSKDINSLVLSLYTTLLISLFTVVDPLSTPFDLTIPSLQQTHNTFFVLA